MDFIDHIKQQIQEYEMNMQAGKMPDKLTDYMWNLLQNYQLGKISKTSLQRKMTQIQEITNLGQDNRQSSQLPKKRAY